MKLKGNIWVFKEKDNINTDILYPGKFLQQKLSDKEMAKVTFHNYDQNLTQAIQNNKLENEILLWGKDAGAGSSRIQAAKGLKYNGVTAVIAESFAGIYYRSGINIGFPLITCPELIHDVYSKLDSNFFGNRKAESLAEDNYLEIDLENGLVNYLNPVGTQQYQFPKLPKELLEIFKAGGLIASIKKSVQKGGKQR